MCEDKKVVEAPAVIIPKRGYDLANHILGKDFIPPELIDGATNVSYDNKLFQYFFDTLPSEEVMVWLRDTDQGFALIAGPSFKMSLLVITNFKSQLFYDKRGGWYTEEQQAFSRDDKIMPE